MATVAASTFVSPILGAVVAGAGNSIVNQGFNNGWDNIDYGKVMVSTGLSIVTYAAGGKINKWLEKPLGKATNWIKNDILKATAQDAIGGAMGGFVIGTGLAIQHADDLEDGFGIVGKQTLQGAALGGLSGFARGYTEHIQKPKTNEEHHFATNKNKKFTPEMEEIVKKYNLKLDDEWNIEKLPHRGRHPNAYHAWVLEQMRIIDMTPRMNQELFIEQFNLRVKLPVQQNPNMLRKNYWTN